MVKVYDERVSTERIACMRLVVFPADELAEQTLRELYTFDETCKTKLEVSTKDGIVCNSTQNIEKKILSDFPNSYLRMRITQGGKRLYSYYIDLSDTMSEKDLKNGFTRIERDLRLF